MRTWSLFHSVRSVWVSRPNGLGPTLLYFRMLCFASCIPILVRLPLGLQERLLGLGARSPTVDPERLARVKNCLDSVLDLGPPLVRRGCLTRGLLRYRFLGREGIPVSLVFGIGRVVGGARYSGHCWLEVNDCPILEREDPRAVFTEMYRFSSSDGSFADTGSLADAGIHQLEYSPERSNA